MILYRLKNWKAELRGRIWHFAQRMLRAGQVSTVSAIIIYPNGRRKDLGIISRRCVTNAGVAALFSVSSPIGITSFNSHDSGTGTNVESVNDTALQSPAGPAKVTGTMSNPTPGTYRSTATITYTATQNITEHGIFYGSILWDRSVFAGIGVVSGLSIIFTHDCVAVAGG